MSELKYHDMGYRPASHYPAEPAMRGWRDDYETRLEAMRLAVSIATYEGRPVLEVAEEIKVWLYGGMPTPLAAA